MFKEFFTFPAGFAGPSTDKPRNKHVMQIYLLGGL